MTFSRQPILLVYMHADQQLLTSWHVLEPAGTPPARIISIYCFVDPLRLLLCASGDSVKVFSTSTAECIHDLQGHSKLVTGVVLNPLNHLQVSLTNLSETFGY